MNRIETAQEVVTRTPKQQNESIAKSTSRVRRALNKYHANVHSKPLMPIYDDCIDHYLDD